MSFTLRTLDPQRNLTSQLSMRAIEHAIPRAHVEAALTEHDAWHERERKLSMPFVVFTLIMMSLLRHVSIGHVMRRAVQGVRFLWPDPPAGPPAGPPKANAFSYRRYRLGVAPMETLFKTTARPIATRETPGAFRFGKRLMAIDGTTFTVPDTPENEGHFGRHPTGRGRTAFPQVQAVLLVEAGTHVVCDAGFWPVNESERTGGYRMLRSLSTEMLVLWDRGFHSFDMVQGALARGADVLARLPAHVKPEVVGVLADGSRLVRLRPSAYRRRQAGEHLRLRLIEYTIEDELRTRRYPATASATGS